MKFKNIPENKMSKENVSSEKIQDNLLDAAAKIVSAIVSKPEFDMGDLSGVVVNVFKSLQKINLSPVAVPAGKNPAVPISESVHDDYIICLEDGKRLSMLKRHLNTTYGLTLEQYKERWGLPQNYPTVSANYAKRRSSIAKNIGLGKTGRKKTRVLQAAS